MTNEQIRIAVAEACGWELNMAPYGPFTQKGSKELWTNYPNYPADLNACHEMETWLRKNGDQFQWLNYTRELFKVIWSRHPTSDDDVGSGLSWNVICATALQRCEAFLRTLNMWKETENETKLA